MMDQPLRLGAILATLAAIGFGGSGPATAQAVRDEADGKAAATPKKGAMKAEMASGVILKVEDLPGEGEAKKDGEAAKSKKGDRAGRGKRLTVNTAVVWEDWARDQGPDAATESPKVAAKEGANSVATEGQPRSPETMVTIDLNQETRIETRFRSTTDAASEGAKTPAGAAKAAKDPAESISEDKGSPEGKAESFDLASLKPGLFVDVEYRHQPSRNRAIRVVVLRPVGGPQTPAGETVPAAEPAPKKKGARDRDD